MLCAVALFSRSTHAAAFEWRDCDWTAGSPTTGQTKAQSFSGIPAYDITVSIYNTGLTNQGGYPLGFNQPIASFSFDRSNNDAAPGQQAVGLGPITYTVIPETNPGFFGVASCVGAVLCEVIRRRIERRKIRLRAARISS
jgi:hypothetical protein